MTTSGCVMSGVTSDSGRCRACTCRTFATTSGFVVMGDPTDATDSNLFFGSSSTAVDFGVNEGAASVTFGFWTVGKAAMISFSSDPGYISPLATFSVSLLWPFREGLIFVTGIGASRASSLALRSSALFLSASAFC